MTATLDLTRGTSFAFELVRGTFDVYLDGQQIGSLPLAGSVRLPIPPGAHGLLLRAGRRHSKECRFDVPDGDEVAFACHGAKVWPTWALSFLVPGLGIGLHQR